MPSPHGHTTTYEGNQADGNSISIFGNVYGGLQLPDWPREASDSSPHQCLRDLIVTDPRDDRARIEDEKDTLLKDCYAWILDDASFQRWREGVSRLLWIRGDPGKGKTMMTMGLISELSGRKEVRSLQRTTSRIPKLKLSLNQDTTSAPRPQLLAYFFCQSTQPQLNNAVSVLRGLIYLLVAQQDQLMRHVQKRYKAVGSKLFEGPNAIHALKEILSDILNDPALPMTYLLVDALDECTTGLSTLLRTITDDSLARRSKIKWLVTSRNLPEIEQYLQPDSAGIKVSLEVSANQVSRAVAAFINFKVQDLATVKRYEARLQEEVEKVLRSRAEGTFLWVSLVCKELEKVPFYSTREVLHTLPPGLDPLYDRMMTQILAQDHIKTREYCKDVLRAVTVAFRPLRLKELVVVAGLTSDQFNDPQAVVDLVGRCGSFLTIRQDTVSFIHLSAKDYFMTGNGQQILDGAAATEQGQVIHRLINAMRNTLQRDLCSLEKQGPQIKGITEQIQDSVLSQIAYACEYWIEHLCALDLTSSATSKYILQDGGIVDLFLQKKFLYWLEALSLCKNVSKGVVAIEKLWLLLQGREKTNELARLVQDTHRFVMYHKTAIETTALQAYVSALLFSPKKSLVRKLFQHEEPDDIKIIPAMDDNWSACLQTLEGHSHGVSSVAFSHDSARLASASEDRTVKIWDARSGACLQTLEGHSHGVRSVAFSHDSARLASASFDKTIKIWDASSGACLQTLKGHSDMVTSVVFSHDSTRLASASDDKTVKIWDASSGACLQTPKGHSGTVSSVAFSHDSTRLASASHDRIVKIWDASSGACLQTLEGHSHGVNSVVFSHDSARLTSASDDKTVKIWDASSGACLQTLEGHSDWVWSVVFSHDSTRLASASGDKTIKIWDASSGVCLQTLEGHSGWVRSMAFSHDSTRLASASHDRIVKIWDASSGACLQTLEGHSDAVSSVAFSHDSTRLASASEDSTVKIWDASSGACLQTLEGHSDWVSSVAFSHDLTQLASASGDRTVKIWDARSGACLQTLEGHSDWVNSVAFSHDSTRLASASGDRTVKIWDASSGACLQTLEGHSHGVNSVAFSHDSTRLASGDRTVKIWDASSGACLQTLEGHSHGSLWPSRTTRPAQRRVPADARGP
ncbi:hypothetical protein NX059_012301 [Plenodomus lindquistii]|nr:hypothetical protein NX059_012301 [Plenodomus lindquistii]